MLPEPLVTIRTYSTADEAQGDLATLDAEGIVAYVRVGGHGRGGGAAATLNVAESDVARSMEIVGPDPYEAASDDTDDPDGDYACPRCRSTRSKALPPYYLIALVVGAAAWSWVASQQRWSWVVALGVIVPLALHRIDRRAPQWRCLNCGLAWNQDAVRRKRADARRHAVE